jgi:hypothetical protein
MRTFPEAEAKTPETMDPSIQRIAAGVPLQALA